MWQRVFDLFPILQQYKSALNIKLWLVSNSAQLIPSIEENSLQKSYINSENTIKYYGITSFIIEFIYLISLLNLFQKTSSKKCLIK